MVCETLVAQAAGARPEPKKVMIHRFYYFTTLFVQREPNPLVARLPAPSQRTTLLFRWHSPLFLVRRIRFPAPITIGCGRSEIERLHVTFRSCSSSFGNISHDFCVASWVLIASSGANCQDTLKDATVSAPIHLLGTPYIRGTSPAMEPRPLMKQTSQTAVGATWAADDAACIPRFFYESSGLSTQSLSQMPSYDVWRRIGMFELRWWMTLEE